MKTKTTYRLTIQDTGDTRPVESRLQAMLKRMLRTFGFRVKRIEDLTKEAEALPGRDGPIRQALPPTICPTAEKV